MNSIFADILKNINASNLLDTLYKIEDNSIARFFILCRDYDFLYKGEDEVLLVKYDFLSEEDRKQFWLADEEMFDDEIPLYFSEANYRKSPAYLLHLLKKEVQDWEYNGKTFSIRLLLVCNYSIINYEDMLPVWESMGITVVHQCDMHWGLIPDEVKTSFCLRADGSRKNDVKLEELDDNMRAFFDRFVLSLKLTPNKIEEIVLDDDDDLNDEDDSEDKDLDEWDMDYSMDEEKDNSENDAIKEKSVDKWPVPYTKCFKLLDFALFRLNNPWIDYSEAVSNNVSLTLFNQDKLYRVLMVLNAKNLLEKDYEFPFKIKLFNELGQEVMDVSLDSSIVGEGEDKVVQLTCGLDVPVWEKGMYLIEIRFRNEIVVSTFFEVGDKDIEGKYSIHAIQPKTNIAGKKILKSEQMDNPMEALDKMIGLETIKEQLKSYQNTAMFAMKREAMGLLTDFPPLHAAFLGNPGTGKTAVAHLLGTILKNMGLLTKGHVVFEERSTLMGQNYASEQEKTLQALERAKGGILFIDEAYTLYKPDDKRDPGINVIETLLTALSDENNRDWMLLLAGYTDPMLKLFSTNPGLESRIPECNRFYFQDYTVEELMQIADLYCREHNYRMTSEARKAFHAKVKKDYSRKTDTFGNGRYIKSLLTTEVIPAMSLRVNKLLNPTLKQLMTIEREDIPQQKLKDYRKPLKKLQDMVGLNLLKQNIESHLNMVKLNMLRAEQGIPTEMPPLHMVFMGNPGTGKTTVADLIGEIYASMGLLSIGRVVKVERKDLVGTVIGETEKKTAEILKRAQGNVLFIDEAYTLFDNSKQGNDYGRRSMEVLLTTLSKEQIDMMVIFAGYPKEMSEFLDMNPGLRSRVPYTFYFEDYSVDELMQIAKEVVQKQNFYFSPAALSELRKVVEAQLQKKDACWGNARFITRIISTHIIPAMSNRLMELPPHKLQNKKTLQMICKSDIPLSVDGMYSEDFDEKAIKRILKKLDAMVGLHQVKRAIHNFVDVARYCHQHGQSYFSRESMRWVFTGNTGTGKSTVAGIMGELLKAMNVLDKGHLVEVKAEELYSVPEYKVDDVLQSAMKRSRDGLLFIDGDAPQFKNVENCFNGESLRFKLSSLMADLPGVYALVVAEHAPRQHTLTKSLIENGMPEFNHTLHFEDYTESELLQILEQGLKKKKLYFETEARCHMSAYIYHMCKQRELGYANARTMKLLANAISDKYLLRVSRLKEPDTKSIIWEDVKEFVWKLLNGNKRIGF